MSEQLLRNRSGQVVGKITTKSDGKQEIRNSSGQIRGSYDPKRDETKDHMGKLVGKGNLLATLISL